MRFPRLICYKLFIMMILLVTLFIKQFSKSYSNFLLFSSFYDKRTTSDYFIVSCPESISGIYNHSEIVDKYENSVFNWQNTRSKEGKVWSPKYCKPIHETIAVIIPLLYSKRTSSIRLLLPKIQRFLEAQYIPYTIITVSQIGNEHFNSGILYNIGVMPTPNWINCFILATDDLVPDLYDITFTCNLSYPEFISTVIKQLNYERSTYFDGVVAFTRKQFYAVNGFSNKYWETKGARYDIYNRTILHFQKVDRLPDKVGRFTYYGSDNIKNNDQSRRYNNSHTSDDYDVDGINTQVLTIQENKTKKRQNSLNRYNVGAIKR
ncbi:hypothetical protein GJ496_008005 [Pomphorhynchus laevis]|nr:hypothetical protein GJ496_008005 [Pomphorhynchus laevis]